MDFKGQGKKDYGSHGNRRVKSEIMVMVTDKQQELDEEGEKKEN